MAAEAAVAADGHAEQPQQHPQQQQLDAAGGGASTSGGAPLGLAGYVASLPPSARAALYASPWTCCAVFRALPPLARQYALRLLYAPPGGVGGALVDAWARPDTTSRRKHEAALAALRELSLLAEEGRGCAGGRSP